MESFEEHGRFWLPEQGDRQVAGVLSFDYETGGRLALIGALHEHPIVNTPEAVDRLILGHVGSDDVTLVRCMLRNNEQKGGGWLEESWPPQAILRGACLEDAEDLAFDNAYFEIDALLEWTNRARIRRDYRDGDVRPLTGVAIQLDEMSPEWTELDDGGELEIRFPWSTDGDCVRDSTVRQRCVIHRTWKAVQGLDDVLSEIRLFQHLLTIAVNEACSYRTITLQHPDVTIEDTDRTYREPIEFYAAPKAASLSEPPHPANMLFRLNDLGGMDGLKRWRAVAWKYSRVLNMATSIRYMPGLFGENKLANTTSAAEGLHRILLPGKAIDDDEYQGLRRSMLKSVADGGHRNHLGAQLRHANEHYLVPGSASLLSTPPRRRTR